MLDRLRPQQKRPEAFAEASKAVADLLAAEAREAALGTTPEDASDEEQDDEAGSAGPPFRPRCCRSCHVVHDRGLPAILALRARAAASGQHRQLPMAGCQASLAGSGGRGCGGAGERELSRHGSSQAEGEAEAAGSSDDELAVRDLSNIDPTFESDFAQLLSESRCAGCAPPAGWLAGACAQSHVPEQVVRPRPCRASPFAGHS